MATSLCSFLAVVFLLSGASQTAQDLASSPACAQGVASQRLKAMFAAAENPGVALVETFFGIRRLEPFEGFSVGIVQRNSDTGVAKVISKFFTGDLVELDRYLRVRSQQHEKVLIAKSQESLVNRQGIVGIQFVGARSADDLPATGYAIEGKADFQCTTALFAKISFGTVLWTTDLR